MAIINPGKGGRLSQEIGSKLKRLRMEKGLTQKELAAKVKGGVDYTYIGKIERGQQSPSLKVLQGISETLSVPIGSFFVDEPDTVVYVNFAAELGEITRNEKGRELIRALKHIDEADMSLLVEIIKIFARQRGLERGEKQKDSSSPVGGLMLPENKKPTVRKSEY
jgi:transcriptional regulator with XRE-family HTH domain